VLGNAFFFAQSVHPAGRPGGRVLASVVMSPFESAILGVIQGITETLPISSSAHLYVVPTMLGWPYGGLAYDVALHWGTLIALLVAFWRDWYDLIRNAFSPDLELRAETRGMWLRLIAASVPAAIIGLLLKDIAGSWLRSLPLQASMLLLFGFLLWAADRFRPAGTAQKVPGWGTCMFIGMAQSLALVPGVSRSGVTITAGRMGGMTRVSAARFSFLLATPITFGAGVLKMRDITEAIPTSTVVIGVVSAAVFGLLAIRMLLHWLGRAGFGWFFAYRAALAVVILMFGARG